MVIPSSLLLLIACIIVLVVFGEESRYYVSWPRLDPTHVTPWNRDYVRELFPAPMFTDGNDTSRKNIVVVVCAVSDHLPAIEKILDEHNGHLPIMIHPSDEFLGTNANTFACTRLYHRFTVVLREYALGNHHATNVLQLPLGYMFDALYDNVTIPENASKESMYALTQFHTHNLYPS